MFKRDGKGGERRLGSVITEIVGANIFVIQILLIH